MISWAAGERGEVGRDEKRKARYLQVGMLQICAYIYYHPLGRRFQNNSDPIWTCCRQMRVEMLSRIHLGTVDGL